MTIKGQCAKDFMYLDVSVHHCPCANFFTSFSNTDIDHIVIKNRLMNIFNNNKLPCLLCPVCFSVITTIPKDVCSPLIK